MLVDPGLEKRRAKDLGRMLKKKEKVQKKLDKLEAKHRSGRIAGAKYHDRKATFRRLIAGFDKEARKIKGKSSMK